MNPIRMTCAPRLPAARMWSACAALGMEDDIRFCLQEDVMDAVPCYVDGVIRDSYA